MFIFNDQWTSSKFGYMTYFCLQKLWIITSAWKQIIYNLYTSRDVYVYFEKVISNNSLYFVATSLGIRIC